METFANDVQQALRVTSILIIVLAVVRTIFVLRALERLTRWWLLPVIGAVFGIMGLFLVEHITFVLHPNVKFYLTMSGSSSSYGSYEQILLRQGALGFSLILAQLVAIGLLASDFLPIILFWRRKKEMVVTSNI